MDRTQKNIIEKRLKCKGSVTSWQAFIWYGITRLSAIIYCLRREGMDITTETITKRNRYGNTCTFAKYTLAKQRNGEIK